MKEEPAGADGIKTPEQKEKILEANNSFGGTLGRLLVLKESYPVLRSNENFLRLQNSLEGTENRINIARIDYNKSVTVYNTTRNQFPGVLTAGLMGFPEELYFKAQEGTNIAPDVGSPDALRQKKTDKSTEDIKEELKPVRTAH